ncbi:hypothetical protein GW17_00000185 [Ensete ventricosum]|nr:hypothetical protein GW17_00000185 [Ensete ventricosum]
MKEDKATPRLLVGEQGVASLQRRKTTASPSNGRTRQCLIPMKEDEASPRLPTGEQGTGSSQCGKMRHCLAFQQKNEVMPHSNEGR